MAKKLSAQKRSEYTCSAKACPRPADLRRFPEIQREVNKEWAKRRRHCRSGQAKARRVAAKQQWPSSKQVKVKKRGKGR